MRIQLLDSQPFIQFVLSSSLAPLPSSAVFSCAAPEILHETDPRLFGLMIALAAGTAAAAPIGTSAGTLAGQSITNTASAVFIDPTNNTVTPNPILSNTVEAVVNAVTGFDVMYQDSSSDNTSATAPAVSYDKANIVPGSIVSTRYTVVNNSNIANYVVDLDSVVSTVHATGNGSTATLSAANVNYYAVDTNGDKTGSAITSVTLISVGASGV